jgi:hypothetical protein
MNKKAQVFYDILSWILFIIGITVWILILSFTNAGRSYAVNNKVERLGGELSMISIFRSNYDGLTISEHLRYSYNTDDPEYFFEVFNKYLEQSYGAEVCWKLLINDKSFVSEPCSTQSKEELLQSQVYIPDNLKVGLIITGYKK